MKLEEMKDEIRYLREQKQALLDGWNEVERALQEVVSSRSGRDADDLLIFVNRVLDARNQMNRNLGRIR